MDRYLADSNEDDRQEVVVVPKVAFDAMQAQANAAFAASKSWRILAMITGFIVTLFTVYQAGSRIYEALAREEQGVEILDLLSTVNNKLDEAEAANDLIVETLSEEPILITEDQIQGFAATVDCNNRAALQELIDQLAAQGGLAEDIQVIDNCDPAP